MMTSEYHGCEVEWKLEGRVARCDGSCLYVASIHFVSGYGDVVTLDELCGLATELSGCGGYAQLVQCSAKVTQQRGSVICGEEW